MKAAPPTSGSVRRAVLALSHELGREDRHLAILGEGNTSARLSSGTFVVKASGSSLATLSPGELTECRFAGILALLDAGTAGDEAIRRELLAARIDPRQGRPSVEAIFHAYLLTLPGVNFVGHTHPVSVNGILCSGSAGAFASRRMFPDEIVCCGGASVLVPYADPGLRLAQAIRRGTTRFIEQRGEVPRVILLQNHGLIALGPTPKAVLAATLMAEKAARIFSGAAALGKSPRFLSPAQVVRIGGRSDERHRQRLLGI